MPNKTKNMNVEYAEKIVASGNMEPEFEEALKFLTENAPDSSVLREYNEKMNQKVKKTFDELMGGANQDRNEREVLGKAETDLSDDKAVAANIRNIGAIMEDEQFKNYVNLTTNRDAVHVNVDSDGTVLGETKGKDALTAAQDDLLRKKYINEMMEAAKHEVMMFYAQDKKFAAYNDEQKRKILQDGVADVFNLKMAKAVAASAVNDASPEQSVPNTPAYEAYEQQSLADMRAALEAYYTKKPVKVKTRRIMESSVVTSQAMDEYEADMSKKQLNDAAGEFNKKKEDYNAKRRAFWGKAFDYAKKMWQGMKQNKKRILSDAGVVLAAGVAATISAPAAIAAASGMGLYFAAGSFAWLLNDERRKMAAKSQNASEWKGFKGLSKAYKSMDENAKKKFWRQGSIQATAGVAGAALFGAAAAGAIFNTASGVVAGRIANSAARSVGSITNQGVNWAMAAKEYKKNASEENKVLLDEAKTNFWVSTSVAVAANAASAYLGLNHDNAASEATNAQSEANATIAPASVTKVNTIVAPSDTISEQTDTVATAPVAAEGNNVDGGTASDAVQSTDVNTEIKVPTEWDSSMQITKAHWNLMQQRFADSESTISFEDAYRNVVNAKAANPELFKDIDPVKVVDEYFLKDSWVKDWDSMGVFDSKDALMSARHLNPNAKIVDVTDFDNVEASKNAIYHSQITITDADGNPKTLDFYSTDVKILHQHDTMFRLQRIIECGDKVKIPVNDANAMILAERLRGNRNISVKSFGGCGEDDTYTRFAQKHPHSHPAPAEPANVDETTVDQAKSETPAKVEETTVNQQKEGTISWKHSKYTTGDNTIDSGTGSKPEKVIGSGVAPETPARVAMQKLGLDRGV